MFEHLIPWQSTMYMFHRTCFIHYFPLSGWIFTILGYNLTCEIKPLTVLVSQSPETRADWWSWCVRILIQFNSVSSTINPPNSTSFPSVRRMDGWMDGSISTKLAPGQSSTAEICISMTQPTREESLTHHHHHLFGESNAYTFHTCIWNK